MLRPGSIAHAVTRTWASVACASQGASCGTAAAAVAAAGPCGTGVPAALASRWHSLAAEQPCSAHSINDTGLPGRDAFRSCTSVSSNSSEHLHPHWTHSIGARALAFSTSAPALEAASGTPQAAAATPAASSAAASSAAQPSHAPPRPQQQQHKQQQRPRVEVLSPSSDIPAASRAMLADEREALAAEAAGTKARLRDKRRPQPASSAEGAKGAAATLTSPSASASSTPSTMDLSSGDLAASDPEVRLVFDKLVGGLTKCGKKGVARRIVADAMRIMRQQLRKGNLDEIKRIGNPAGMSAGRKGLARLSRLSRLALLKERKGAGPASPA